MVRPALVAIALCAGLLCSAAASAEDPEGWAYVLAGEMLSPFCPGRTLAECPSKQAESLRLWIIVQEAAGRTRTDVEQELFERFGDEVRPTPKAEGLGLTVYALPFVAFLGGAGLVAVALRRLTASGGEAPAAAPIAGDTELERIVDEELGA